MQRRVLVRLLQTWGHPVTEACDGLAALEVLERAGTRPRLILLDLMLPILDGQEVARRVRSTWPEIRILVCSAILQGPIEDRLRRLGVQGFLPKPFSAKSLRGEICRLMDLDGAGSPNGP